MRPSESKCGRALHQQKKKDEEDIRYRETEEAREFSKMRMFGRPGHGAPTVDNRKKRFTEHQFDKLRHGPDQPGAGAASYQPEEFRPPPPPARRFQEDVLDNVSSFSFFHLLDKNNFICRTLWPSADQAVEPRRGQSRAGSGRRYSGTRRSGDSGLSRGWTSSSAQVPG